MDQAPQKDDIAALYLHPDVSASPYQPASCSFLEARSDWRRSSSASDPRSIAGRYSAAPQW